MKKRKRANKSARDKKYWRKRLELSLKEMQPYYHHLNLRCSDIDDVALELILEKVKGVNMLDLNETAITNHAVKLISKLEYVKELRLKENYQLNNECIEDLNKINGLEFLHVKSTNITIDGILQLHALSGLKTLLFSADEAEQEQFKQKLLQARALFPHCQLVVNSRAVYFDELFN